MSSLQAIYARCFRQWLEDETADFGPTMAALDRALSRGSEWDKRIGTGISRLSRACGKIQKKCDRFTQKYGRADHTEQTSPSAENNSTAP